eukprot:m.118975 g.118975  ORF g.118975 m.118975 type:complete len:81 (-) comp23154_c0_seq1:59-301(-)
MSKDKNKDEKAKRVRKKPVVDENVDMKALFRQDKWKSVRTTTLKWWLGKQGIKVKSKLTKDKLIDVVKQTLGSVANVQQA